MGDLVTLRPVTEDDLSWLASLKNSPAGSGVHEWHGWSDPQRKRRQWAESGLLSDNGGAPVVRRRPHRGGPPSLAPGPTRAAPAARGARRRAVPAAPGPRPPPP